MKFDPGDLYYYMLDLFVKHYLSTDRTKKLCIFNEGGARAGKTIDFIHLVISICDHNRNAGLQIGFFRYTLKDAREKLYEQDFKPTLQQYVEIFDSSCARAEKQSPEYNLYGNTIYFRGLEDDTEQVSYDIVFCNEMLEIPEKSFISGLMMRCKMLFVGDWNPKYTDHWAFGFEGQDNTFYTHTTYKNNKHCPLAIKRQIESYCPWMLEDLGLPENERRANVKNIEDRTADLFLWKVYGEGERCAREGLIFRDVTYTDKLPDVFDNRHFGLDFGRTTGINAFVDVRDIYENGRFKIYYDCPIYSSFESIVKLYEVIKVYYEKTYAGGQWIVFSDLAEPQKISDLNIYSQRDGLNMCFVGAKKWEECVNWRIDLMKRHQMILVDRKHIRREQENYRYASVNGIQLNEPEKNGFDHFFDASGYALQYSEYLR